MIYLVLFGLSCVQAVNVNEELVKAEIVPDVLESLPKCIRKLTVEYEDGLQVNFGNELTPSQVSNRPSVSWTSRNNETLHTLVMIDPDAPSRSTPTLREIKHWILVNIPGNSTAGGEYLADYRGSAPPQNTGLHRYIFLLYKQKSRLSVENPISSENREKRANFRVSSFARENSLEGPIAANFYQAQYEN